MTVQNEIDVPVALCVHEHWPTGKVESVIEHKWFQPSSWALIVCRIFAEETLVGAVYGLIYEVREELDTVVAFSNPVQLKWLQTRINVFFLIMWVT